MPTSAFIFVDKGDQGILCPAKTNQHCKLDPNLKIHNQEINKIRIGIEYIFGYLQKFNLLAERYHNRAND